MEAKASSGEDAKALSPGVLTRVFFWQDLMNYKQLLNCNSWSYTYPVDIPYSKKKKKLSDVGNTLYVI